jgi:hypothetical protein
MSKDETVNKTIAISHSNSIDNFIRPAEISPVSPAPEILRARSRSPGHGRSGFGVSTSNISQPVGEGMLSAGDNSAIVNTDLANIKDGMGRSIRLKDNMYDKLLHNLDPKAVPSGVGSDFHQPSHLIDEVVNSKPKSSIHIVKTERPSRSVPFKRHSKETGYGTPSQYSHIKPDQIESNPDISMERRTTPTPPAKPSIMLSKHEMTFIIDDSKDYGKPNHLLFRPKHIQPVQIIDKQEEISQFFRRQYSKKSPVRNPKALAKKKAISETRRAASSDPFIKLKIERLENLYRLDGN